MNIRYTQCNGHVSMYKARRGKAKVVSWPTLRKGILKHKNLMNRDINSDLETKRMMK